MGERSDYTKRLKEYMIVLQKRVTLVTMVLIGSRARNDALQSSDIDLLIISDDFQDMPYLVRLDLVTEHWAPPPSLDVFPHTTKEVQQRSKGLSLHILEALDNGEILYDTGFFRQLRLEFERKIATQKIVRYQYGYEITSES